MLQRFVYWVFVCLCISCILPGMIIACLSLVAMVIQMSLVPRQCTHRSPTTHLLTTFASFAYRNDLQTLNTISPNHPFTITVHHNNVHSRIHLRTHWGRRWFHLHHSRVCSHRNNRRTGIATEYISHLCRNTQGCSRNGGG